MFSKLLENIGYHDKSDENYLTKSLRKEAIKWACVLGVPECRNETTLELLKELQKSKAE